jgi:hypothetical protein
VELGEAEALGLLDDDDPGLGHVDADLDDGGGDEEAGLAAGEGLEGGGLVGAGQAAVH